MAIIDLGSVTLADVWFDVGVLRRINVGNLVHERDIHFEATRAENVGIRKIL